MKFNVNGLMAGKITPRITDAIILLIIIVAAIITALPSLHQWWYISDSIHILLQAYHFSPFDYFFNPTRYQLLTTSNLTPWITLSFDTDLWLWGPNPTAFHIHQIVDLALVGISTYWLCRLWADRLTAMLCSLTLLFQAPIAFASIALSNRHYLEGTILVTISLYGFYRSEVNHTESSRWWLLLSAICYGLSITAKEIFVPLVVALFFLSRKTLVERLSRLSGHITLALLYCGWRYWMLGQLVGGYESDIAPDILKLDVLAHELAYIGLSLPKALSYSLPGSYLFIILCGSLLAVGAIAKTFRWSAAAAIFLCVVVPVLPVTWVAKFFGIEHSLRYFLAIGWTLTLFLSVLIPRLSDRWMRAIALTALSVACVLMAIGNYEPIREISNLKYFTKPKCHQFVWSKDDDSIMILPTSLFLKDGLAGIAHLKGAYTGHRGPYVYAGDIALPENYAQKNVFVQVNKKNGCFVLDHERKKTLLERAKSARMATDLGAKISWHSNSVEWGLTKQEQGQNYLVIRGANASYRYTLGKPIIDLPQLRIMLFMYGVHGPASVHIEHVMSDGNTVYSPPVPVPDYVFDFWRDGENMSAATEPQR